MSSLQTPPDLKIIPALEMKGKDRRHVCGRTGEGEGTVERLTTSVETTESENIEEAVEETEELINLGENSQPDQELEEVDIFEVGRDGILSPTPSIPNRPGSSHSQQSTPSFRQEKTKIHEKMARAIDSFNKICEARNQTALQQKNEGDMNFMRSIVEDMQILIPSKRVKFEREIMDLLVKYIDDADYD
ncbi:unnamed protein product [Phaedon cochleariae]|uniref:BESS domain-containing protein n=1 Tax=Phaedon cochleariae TaxID=80249 RepID=A0A9P0DLH4_PHACE|nr:unnamed protein product [Phaedon cochleariae]